MRQSLKIHLLFTLLPVFHSNSKVLTDFMFCILFITIAIYLANIRNNLTVFCDIVSQNTDLLLRSVTAFNHKIYQANVPENAVQLIGHVNSSFSVLLLQLT